MTEFEPSLDQPIEVAPGEFKPLGDCTRSDLEGAAAVAEEAGRLSQQCGELAATLADLAATRGGSVSAPTALGEAENLAELREQVELLKEAVVLNTEPRGEG